MEAYTRIKKIHMNCPLCGRRHEVEERKCLSSITIKGEEVTYEERYYFCVNADAEENEFESAVMTNENLLRARNAYRVKHGLLTSEEIVAIRKNYGLSQVELAKLLGWGEATISRYESKAIQDDAYDTMLRLIKDNPLQALEFLKKNGESSGISCSGSEFPDSFLLVFVCSCCVFSGFVSCSCSAVGWGRFSSD